MRPLGKRAGTTVWEDIPHDKRERVNVQTLTLTLDVRVLDNTIELKLDVNGINRLPWKLEAILTPGGTLTTQGDAFATGEGDTAILAQGFSYQLGADTLHWEGGRKEHVFTESMRNSLPKEPNAFTVYNTGFGPQTHTVTLTWS